MDGQKKKTKAIWVVLFILFIVVVAVYLFISSVINEELEPYDLSEDAQTMTEEEYKEACEAISYDDLARNADNLIEKKVKYTGEVQQVVFEGENFDSQYRVSVTKDEEYDWYDVDDCVYVYYDIGDNGRILMNDIITFYGEVIGYEEYTSTAGVNVKLPAVKALYVTIEQTE